MLIFVVLINQKANHMEIMNVKDFTQLGKSELSERVQMLATSLTEREKLVVGFLLTKVGDELISLSEERESFKLGHVHAKFTPESEVANFSDSKVLGFLNYLVKRYKDFLIFTKMHSFSRRKEHFKFTLTTGKPTKGAK